MPALDIYRLDQFRIDGGGGSGSAQPGDVLNGKTFTNNDGEQVGTRDPGKKTASGIGYMKLVSSNQYRMVVSGLNFSPKVIGAKSSEFNTIHVYFDRDQIQANATFYAADQNSVTRYGTITTQSDGFILIFYNADVSKPVYWTADE